MVSLENSHQECGNRGVHAIFRTSGKLDKDIVNVFHLYTVS